MRLSRNLGIAMSLLAGIFYVSVRNAAADQLGSAVDATGSLYSVDLTTATATPIGSTGQLLEGLAISPQGSLFGTDFLGNLFSLSRTTGASTLIGNTGVLARSHDGLEHPPRRRARAWQHRIASNSGISRLLKKAAG